MLGRAKQAVSSVGRSLGLFGAVQRLSEGRLRILGYHGFEMGLPREFRPRLFMDPGAFRARVLALKGLGFDFLELGEAVARVARGSLVRPTVVITIDDGFVSTHRHGLALMRELAVPMTVYVTTYYVTHQHPIFGLAVQYLFWRTAAERLELTGLGLARTGEVALGGREERERLASEIAAHGESRLSEAERVGLARELGVRLGVPFEALEESRALHLMSEAELRELAAAGFDLQLHTHRHRLPLDAALARREIEENREILEPIAGKRLSHLCYPSDTWTQAREHAPALAAAGIASATTDAPGLVGATTPPFELPRFLDSGAISALQFEAEMSGFASALRRVAGR